jgi:hypothetical protein
VTARWLWRCVKVGVVVVGGLTLLCAAPITYVETRCVGTTAATLPPEARRFNIEDAGYRRAEGDSYLSYPEWYIVQAYADLAGVTRQSSESAFDYAGSIFGFWNSLCHATMAATQTKQVTMDQKVTDYIIGISFSGEMGIIGLYERTIGALTAWVRGPTRTPEDAFALATADDYAVFLQQTPWYEFPFWDRLRRFWQETPWRTGSTVRSVERRFAISVEYAGRGLYAIAIGALAGYSPADLRIESVVSNLHPGDIVGNRSLKWIREVGGNAALIETPRYQAFTNILRDLGAHGYDVLEIAGNQRILVTVIEPIGASIAAPGATPLFAIPIQSRPGWHRVGLTVEVPSLTRLIATVEQQGAIFEHAYDY